MNTAVKGIDITIDSQKVIQKLYEVYASKLIAYTLKNYTINEDDATSLVYKTIYRIAEVQDKYSFENKHKHNAFVFKTHINYLRNYYRDNKSFENRNFEVELKDFESAKEEIQTEPSSKLKLLQHLLDQMEDWERILLLMRGQDIPYSEISKFVDKPEKQLKVYYARLKKKLLEDMNETLKRMSNGK